MNTKDRLQQFIKSKRMSVRQFQDSVDVSGSYVANINQSIGGNVLRRIEEVYPELNIDWLIDGNGEMLKEYVKPKKRESNNMVMVLPVSAQAGRLSEFADSVQTKDCEYMQSPIDGVDYALTISGDSMSPEYPSGSHIFIKQINEKAFIDWGRVYVLDTCNGAVIKKILPSVENGKVRCISLNPEYPEFEINISDIYRWYRVLGQFTLR